MDRDEYVDEPTIPDGARLWRTVPLGPLHFQGEFGSRYPELAAGILIAIAPILVIIFFQRSLVSGRHSS